MKAALKSPFIRSAKSLETSERSELVDLYDHYRQMGREWVRRQVLVNNRVDILATFVLGMEVKPFHLRMMQFQFLHPDNLQMAFRGAGKSTTCTVTKAVHLLLKDPDLRILLASKTAQNSEAFLKEIKGQFEKNEKLAEYFGEYYDRRKVTKWDNREIEVLPRTSTKKEASITCVGVDGTIVSKHYDVIISDDLVDEDNARTKYMRDKTRNWYYQTLDPTLEPPDSEVEHRGEHHRLGTRYHYDDLYGHLQANELAEHTNITPALDEHGRSPWPEKYPPEWFEEKRRKSGIIIFNAQYQCDTEAMKGEIFQYDDCQMIEHSDIPTDTNTYVGVDLAISEKEAADHFGIVHIEIDSALNIYVMNFYENQLRFNAQTSKILQYDDDYEPDRIGIETNAYQAAQYQNLKHEADKEQRYVPLKAIITDKDKVTRAWKLSPLFEDKKVFFRKGGNMHLLIEQLVLFPNYRYKDLFDALDLAITASKIKQRKRRKREPGVI